ncbi:NT-type C2 domain [Sesbania bispinosa]|nr:NT-type C2 domain [Sesbania bispinosa]
MVVKMMRWPPWPPLSSKKFEAVVIVQRLQGSNSVQPEEEVRSLVVEIKWKGQKGVALSSLRRSMKRNFTTEVAVSVRDAGVVEWNQEFRNVCTFTGYKENVFYPWEVMFTLSNVSNQGPKTRTSVAGVTSINLAEYVPAAVDKKTEIIVPLNAPGTNDTNLSLCLSISLLKLEALQEYLDAVQRSTMCTPSSPCSVEALPVNKEEFSTLKAGLRRVKIFTDYVSTGRAKKASSKDEGSDGRSSNRSEDSEYRYTSGTDSLDNNDAAIKPEENEEDSCVRHSLSYETLASGNYIGGSPYTRSTLNGKDEFWVYYGSQKSNFGDAHVENYSTCDQIEYHISKPRILSWRKRKLNFKSSKVKGELLLKKHYGEEGGDDIDYDRRLLSSSDEYTCEKCHKIQENITTSQPFVSEFGDNSFTVGSWEHKEVISRDGKMKLHTQIFFASIDQRSERAAGESACAVLVAFIADWLRMNQVEMPIKCEFDSLIKDGSSEWRVLCENKDYMKRFPDKHFDLDTVLQAKIRPVSVVPEKSFVGFFIPEEFEGGDFEFLHGAMSFDSIWEEISHSASELHMVSEPLVYIVSWNDHFFVLKVEQDAYYIIDTLGERLHEGCNQAYILKFDTGTRIEKLHNENKKLEPKSVSVAVQINGSEENVVDGDFIVTPNDRREKIICRGKESCKEYIKSFLAAIPVRELQGDVKKGLKASIPFHHRLQIEFHYTKLK